MQSIEEFFRSYFRARTDIQQGIYSLWEPHLCKFFVANYVPWDKGGSVRNSEQESIISIQPFGDEFEVITSGHYYGKWRERYRVIRDNESWRIVSIEWECWLCDGSGQSKDGKSECSFCESKGWKLRGQLQNNSKP